MESETWEVPNSRFHMVLHSRLWEVPLNLDALLDIPRDVFELPDPYLRIFPQT